MGECPRLHTFDPLTCANPATTVVAGSPHEAMTRAIAADLERRGYIVYVTVSSADEEQIVLAEHRADIKPLWLDLTTVSILILNSQHPKR